MRQSGACDWISAKMESLAYLKKIPSPPPPPSPLSTVLALLPIVTRAKVSHKFLPSSPQLPSIPLVPSLPLTKRSYDDAKLMSQHAFATTGEFPPTDAHNGTTDYGASPRTAAVPSPSLAHIIPTYLMFTGNSADHLGPPANVRLPCQKQTHAGSNSATFQTRNVMTFVLVMPSKWNRSQRTLYCNHTTHAIPSRVYRPTALFCHPPVLLPMCSSDTVSIASRASQQTEENNGKDTSSTQQMVNIAFWVKAY